IQPTLDVAHDLHGVASVPLPAGGPAPVLLQSGWTDALFPVGQALAPYERILRQNPQAPVHLQFGDLGHAPGANVPGDRDDAAFNAQGIAFLASWLKGDAPKLEPGAVTAFAMTCPPNAASGGPFTASSYRALAPRKVNLKTKRRLRITSRGASKALAEELNPLGGRASHCTERSPDRRNRAQFAARVKRPFTMLGRPVLTGRVAAKGRYGQIVARLWDLNPRTGEQLLITRGAYRLADDQKGGFRFTLDGNGWRFARGRRVVVELVGRDEPTYGPSPTTFTATLTKLRATLPVR
ncbi:MAG TPA: CocE/NonD family hydrolase C-terminal non-catalytic domain-containing protein, partial [Solirubrobacteraceae bacterium]|nr:CocE/NonD family hydrolase C-terminal non-catalytic domain-containing protein [Solirubrobacteraceae bacterium]